MSIHWRQLSTAEKIEAVKTAWEPGVSASQIAANFNGVTRNAVIGLYHRYPDDLAGVPLKKPTASVKAMVKAKARKNYTVRVPSTIRPKIDAPQMEPEPEPLPEIGEVEAHLCGRPLPMLSAHQCRWPVNDAPYGEMHLFCGVPADGSYCEAHGSRARHRRAA